MSFENLKISFVRNRGLYPLDPQQTYNTSQMYKTSLKCVKTNLKCITINHKCMNSSLQLPDIHFAAFGACTTFIIFPAFAFVSLQKTGALISIFYIWNSFTSFAFAAWVFSHFQFDRHLHMQIKCGCKSIFKRPHPRTPLKNLNNSLDFCDVIIIQN